MQLDGAPVASWHQRVKRPLVLGLALIACATVTIAASPEANTQRPPVETRRSGR
jgi:hypothetical protein